jgi:hypothetical protein
MLYCLGDNLSVANHRVLELNIFLELLRIDTRGVALDQLDAVGMSTRKIRGEPRAHEAPAQFGAGFLQSLSPRPKPTTTTWTGYYRTTNGTYSAQTH